MKFRHCLFLLVVGSLASRIAAADIVNYTPAVNDRFASGFPSAPVVNTSPSYLGINYDLSGVGWAASNQRRALTMVTPQNFLACVHDPFAVNEQVQFLGGDGVLHTYVVSALQQISVAGTPTDILVGKLTAAIPTGNLVRSYSIGTGLLANSPVIGYGTNTGGPYTNSPQLGTDTVDQAAVAATYAVNSNVYNGNVTTTGYVNNYSGAITNEFHVIGGDSGSPQFAAIGGTPGIALAGITLANDGGVGQQFSFAARPDLYITQINAAINTMGNTNGYSLTVVPVPEPATLLMAGSAATALAFRLRRRAA